MGDRVNVRIVSINPGEKKISLELVPNEPDPWKESGSGLAEQVQTVTVEDVKPAGLERAARERHAGLHPPGRAQDRNPKSKFRKNTPRATSSGCPCSASSRKTGNSS